MGGFGFQARKGSRADLPMMIIPDQIQNLGSDFRMTKLICALRSGAERHEPFRRFEARRGSVIQNLSMIKNDVHTGLDRQKWKRMR